MRSLKKYVTCIMAFFIPSSRSLIFQSLSPPLCYSLKITNYRMRKKKAFMATSAYYVVSKEVQNCMTRQSHFRYTCMYKKSVWTKQWNCNILVQILCNFLHNIHYQDLGCVFLVACSNVIIASWEIKKERLSYRKNYIEEFM